MTRSRRPWVLVVAAALALLPGCGEKLCARLTKVPDKTGSCGGTRQIATMASYAFEGRVEACETTLAEACTTHDLEQMRAFVACYSRLAPCELTAMQTFLDARGVCAMSARGVSDACLAAWPGPRL